MATDAQLELDLLAPGRRIADSDTDLWTKQADGTWACNITLDDPIAPYILTAADLLRVWGPVTIIPEEGL